MNLFLFISNPLNDCCMRCCIVRIVQHLRKAAGLLEAFAHFPGLVKPHAGGLVPVPVE